MFIPGRWCSKLRVGLVACDGAVFRDVLSGEVESGLWNEFWIRVGAIGSLDFRRQQHQIDAGVVTRFNASSNVPMPLIEKGISCTT